MPEVKKSLVDALGEVDEYLATEILEVVKDLVGISHSGDDTRARVTAAAKLVDYVRPPKQHSPLVNINMPSVSSSLRLPPGRLRQARNAKMIEAEKVTQRALAKILPEPSPMHVTKFKGHFDAEHVQQPAIPVAKTPAPLVAKSRTPGAPAKPPPASSIKPELG